MELTVLTLTATGALGITYALQRAALRVLLRAIGADRTPDRARYLWPWWLPEEQSNTELRAHAAEHVLI